MKIILFDISFDFGLEMLYWLVLEVGISRSAWRALTGLINFESNMKSFVESYAVISTMGFYVSL